MNIQTKKRKLLLLAIACLLKREVRNDGKYAWLFNVAYQYAGHAGTCPSLSRFEARATRDTPLTQIYVKCLMASLEFYQDEVMDSVVDSCVRSCAGLLHEGKIRQLFACTHSDVVKKVYQLEIVGIARSIHDELRVNDIPFMRDALEEYGHQDEVTHLLHNEGCHTLACPVYLNVLGRYHN